MSTTALEESKPAVAQSPPGRVPAGLVDRLDHSVAEIARRARGRPAVYVPALVLSNLADYGFIWALIAAWKARRPGTRRRRAVVALGLSGVASFGLNAAIKRVVQRQRPPDAPEAGDPTSRFVRAPTSSSFPSGHTLAAFCTANALAESGAERAAFVTFAGAVGASRVHLGAHHASDVVGGAIIGSALGSLVRRVVDGRGPEGMRGRGRR